MLDASPAFADVVEGTDLPLGYLITITMPDATQLHAEVAVQDVDIEEDNTSNLPDGVLYQSGYTAATMTVTLSGMLDDGGEGDETYTAEMVFGPWRMDSPLARKAIDTLKITADLGAFVYPAELGDDGQAIPETLRRFTGSIDDFDITDDGTVVLTCIDRRNELRASASLPAVVTAPPYNAGLTNEFAMDALLRAASDGKISSSPPPRPGCVLAAMMRSSMWAEVGTLDTNLSTKPLFVPGVFGSAAAMAPDVASTGYDEAVYTTSGPMGTDVYLETWINSAAGLVAWLGNGITSGPTAQGFFLSATTSGIFVIVLNNGVAGTYTFTGVTLPASAGFYFGMKFHQAAGSATWNVTLTIDGTSHASGSQTSSSTRQTDVYDSVTIHRIAGTAIEALQVSNESAPVSNFGFTPTAVLDASLNPLQVVPAVTGDTWAAIQLMTESEGGIAGFDPSGLFRFRNRKSLRGGSAERTITVDSSLKSLSFKGPAAMRRNRIQVPCTSWTFTARKTVWSAADVIKVGANSTLDYPVALDTSGPLVGAIAAVDSGVLPNGGGTVGNTYWRAALDIAGGTPVRSGVSVTIVQATSTQFVVRIKNRRSAPIWMVSPVGYTDMPLGSPCIVVGGIEATPGDSTSADAQWPPVAEGGAISAPGGEVALQLDDNAYRQILIPQQDYAVDLLCELRRPPPLITDLVIVTDPRVVAGSRVRLFYPALGLDDDVVIVRNNIQWDVDGDGTQTIDARPVAKPGGWMLGVPGRSELGVSTYV